MIKFIYSEKATKISRNIKKIGRFFQIIVVSQNLWTLTQTSVSPLKFFTWNNFCLIFPKYSGKADSVVEQLSSGPVKKLGCLCEIKWQSNKIPAVTMYHTQHWTYQLYEQLLLAIVYKHPMALVHNVAKKILNSCFTIFIIQLLSGILFELLCHYLETLGNISCKIKDDGNTNKLYQGFDPIV